MPVFFMKKIYNKNTNLHWNKRSCKNFYSAKENAKSNKIF